MKMTMNGAESAFGLLLRTACPAKGNSVLGNPIDRTGSAAMHLRLVRERSSTGIDLAVSVVLLKHGKQPLCT